MIKEKVVKIYEIECDGCGKTEKLDIKDLKEVTHRDPPEGWTYKMGASAGPRSWMKNDYCPECSKK